MSRYTASQFESDFPDEATCLAAIMRIRHGGTTIYCPACIQRSRFHMVGGRRAYACQACGHHLFPCAGTMFARSRTPLRTWFHAIYLATSRREGIGATELQRQLGVTYKTAWRMAQLLRQMTGTADYRAVLAGFGPRFDAAVFGTAFDAD